MTTRQAVTVHYWAAARAATGTASDELPVAGEVTLAEVLRRVREAHPDDRAARVVGTCSVLVGDRPVSTDDPAAVVVRPGETVELLPPFAGG
jgi:sulfur-carrier protein